MTLTIPEKHQKRIAVDTLKLSDIGANILGGMDKVQARQFLTKIGYSPVRIAKIESD